MKGLLGKFEQKQKQIEGIEAKMQKQGNSNENGKLGVMSRN